MEAVEFDFVVKDSLKALKLYEKIFPVKRVEVSDFKSGTNEVVFTIFEARFHMLDENPEYHLVAPKEGHPQSFWFNIMVNDIDKTYQAAIENGCSEIQGVTRMEEFGISNAQFLDPFGYVWMLHEIHREVSYEERIDILKETFD
ncbi:MAG: VOC family protein [Carnobacterium sp.]|uniref:VOC family protein n=1 Tax=unclassified Carnobacterium TaxID=257487 RepID=UPI0019113CA3|nr:VOC family protein [Carnobacterium sp. CS13]QQP70074.1 VOC family protein [Carnobacterium sp. CS13]